MAMDKEKLLTYFQDHYLSRQEVLFKLPLNYSIDSFWPELLQRRKAQATVLPLYNAMGMPYWYVLTQKMISASERLCEEAINQEKIFDPYRAEMTSAMTEEMFFTSFVEGAQIPLQAAMDFLQRGTEPESIQEQMIWNNRHAWSEMISAIYRPLDEPFVKNLAFMLTEEMDGCASDYRQIDNHMIAAMNEEPYDVPPAYCIPERMGQYFDFLRFGDVHPLIKASAAQAYLLVMRPFPEGNERLSRMISSAVLLRSGYDFFRDISISSAIAKESYRYYKSMCEIIRAENGGDMTYFIEYYLELLVRAIDQRHERILRREQEALARERERAVIPLGMESPEVIPVSVNTNEGSPEEESSQAGSAPTRKSIHLVKEGVLIDPLSEEEYLKKIDEFRQSRYPGNRPLPDRVRKMIEKGLYTFNVAQWAEANEMDRKSADVDCRKLYDKGLVQRGTAGNVMTYTFQIRQPEPSPPDGSDRDKEDSYFWNQVGKYESSVSANRQKVAEMIRKLLSQGRMEFTTQQLSEITGLEWKLARRMCDKMVNDKMISNITPHARTAIFRFNIGTLPVQESLENKHLDEEPPWVDSPPDPTPELREYVRALGYDSENEREQRIGRFLLKMMEKGIYQFSTMDWYEEYKISTSSTTNDLRKAFNLGLIRRHAASDKGGNQFVYTINMTIPNKIRTGELTDLQRSCITRLYERFFKKPFTVEKAAMLLKTKGSSASFHLTNFVERGIMATNGEPGKPLSYTILVNPREYPECFIKGEAIQEIGKRLPMKPTGSQHAVAI